MVEEYQALWNKADTNPSGMRALIQLSDVDAALGKVSDSYWPAILLHGLLGLTLDATAELLQVSHQAVSKSYRKGLDEIQHYINGGT